MCNDIPDLIAVSRLTSGSGLRILQMDSERYS
jgi:hypothetical protein